MIAHVSLFLFLFFSFLLLFLFLLSFSACPRACVALSRPLVSVVPPALAVRVRSSAFLCSSPGLRSFRPRSSPVPRALLARAGGASRARRWLPRLAGVLWCLAPPPPARCGFPGAGPAPAPVPRSSRLWLPAPAPPVPGAAFVPPLPRRRLSLAAPCPLSSASPPPAPPLAPPVSFPARAPPFFPSFVFSSASRAFASRAPRCPAPLCSPFPRGPARWSRLSVVPPARSWPPVGPVGGAAPGGAPPRCSRVWGMWSSSR